MQKSNTTTSAATTALGRIKIFADGASLPALLELSQNPAHRRLHHQPDADAQGRGHRLPRLRAARCWPHITNKPISFEVFADDFAEMKRQAREIAAWGDNVYVKIPITNTQGRVGDRRSSRADAGAGVKLNVTAICTLDQVRETAQALKGGAPSVVSVFAGRIADTGRDPVPLMQRSAGDLRAPPTRTSSCSGPARASCSNIVQAAEVGCHIITVTPDLLKKLELVGKDLGEFSLETVKMFHRDAAGAGYKL